MARFLSEDSNIDKEKFISKLIKEKKIDPMVILAIQEFSIIDRFGWTQEEYDNTPIERINQYNSIMRGIGGVGIKKRDLK